MTKEPFKKLIISRISESASISISFFTNNKNYIGFAFASCLLVLVYNSQTFKSASDSFPEIASQRISEAIASPQAIEVLNNSVSGLGILQDFKSNQKGTLANYRVPNSNKTFKVSLYPIKEVNKIGVGEATRISYIKSKNGIYVVSVSGNISTEKKNQILQNANFSLRK